MKISRISIENFRSFKENSDLNNIKSISVLVGSNSAGKSNIIEILSFLRNMTTKSWSRPFEDLTFDRNKKPIKIELEFELNESERRRIIDSVPSSPEFPDSVLLEEDLFKYVKYKSVVGETRCLEEDLFLWARDQYVHVIHHLWTSKTNTLERVMVNIVSHFHNGGSIDGFLQLKPSKKDNTSGNSFGFFEPINGLPNSSEYIAVLMIHDFLKKIRIFDARRRIEHDYTSSEKWILQESGENLIEVLSTILGEDPTEFSQIMEDYSKITGTEFTVTVPPVKGQNYHTVKLGEDGLNTKTDFLNISSGLHEALILVLAIKKAKENEIICIEEPEIHLHSSSQKRLLRYIQEHAHKNQFFITTHSPMFTGIENTLNTYLVTRNQGKSNILLIEHKDQLQFIRQQLGIRNSDTFGNDYVIFVEGFSEEYAFPIIAKELNFLDVGTDSTNRIRLINLKGNGIIPILDQFLDYLKNSDVEVFLIADGDKKVGKSVHNYIREGRLKQDHVKVWEKEFEDTFESKFIIQSMQNLSKQKSFIFTLSEEELEKERNSGKKVADVLQKHLHENEQPDLEKPKLAIELTEKIISELKSKGADDAPYFFKETKRILNEIQKLDESNSVKETYDIEIPLDASLHIDNPYVKPREHTVKIGHPVVWQNNDEKVHTITSGRREKISTDNDVDNGKPDGLFDKTISPHENFKFTFEKKGIYHYFCNIHKCSHATIIVK